MSHLYLFSYTIERSIELEKGFWFTDDEKILMENPDSTGGNNWVCSITRDPSQEDVLYLCKGKQEGNVRLSKEALPTGQKIEVPLESLIEVDGHKFVFSGKRQLTVDKAREILGKLIVGKIRQGQEKILENLNADLEEIDDLISNKQSILKTLRDEEKVNLKKIHDLNEYKKMDATLLNNIKIYQKRISQYELKIVELKHEIETSKIKIGVEEDKLKQLKTIIEKASHEVDILSTSDLKERIDEVNKKLIELSEEREEILGQIDERIQMQAARQRKKVS